MTPQSVFSAAVRASDGEPPAFVTDAGGRFGIYRRNHFSSLVAALGQTFPVIKRLVGDDFFDATASYFVTQHGPRSRIIAEYGADFADFVGAFEPAQGLPYLADVARLEYARVRAFHAADHGPPDTNGETAIAAVLGCRIALHPSATLIVSAHPVLGIWQTNQLAAPVAVEQWEDEACLVHRDGDAVVQTPVDHATRHFLETLIEAESLETALLTLAEPAMAGAALLQFIRLARAGALVAAADLTRIS